ncbi:MAG TPA: STAS domain-containing protein [Terriglobales bacterium]|nr:STAS domain-containing protein [Terriglobales bacterium]
MDISVRKQGGVQVIKLRGELKLGEPVNQFRQTMEELIAGGDNKIIISLEELRFMDSSGIGALMRSFASAKQHGGTIKLVNPTKLVLQTLKLVSVLNLFEVFNDDATAVASFG